jgi:GNAT superfamily N-acetyltransferase
MGRHEVLDRAGAAALAPELARWDAARTYAGPELHAGDLGWHLKFADEVLAGSMHAWWAGSELMAVSLVEGNVCRPRVRPDLLQDAGVSGEVADLLDGLAGDQLWTEAAPGSALRHDLVARGWELDPDPWTVLHADGARWLEADRGDVVRGSDDIAGRAAVQRAGFERSTFDEASWHRMAAGPGFRPDLDLIVRHDGTPAAVGTAWLSVEGGPGYIEPMAAHPDHRGRGFGRAVVGAMIDACLRAGASGVSVATPSRNTAGVATYVSAGMVPVETLQGLVVRR